MSDGARAREAARRYGAAWSALETDGIDGLLALTTPQIRFKDPFNDVPGRDSLRRVLEKMFEEAPGIRAEVLDVAAGDAADAAYLRWRMTLPSDKGPPLVLSGMTHLIVTPDALIAEHIDYWDAAEQLYERVPVLGSILRLIKKRLAA